MTEGEGERENGKEIERGEGGINNAGQVPIVWRRPIAAQGAAQETL